MDKNDSFANVYGINPIDYREVKIESANFSVRTYGRLRANKIYTVEELLKRNEVDILSVKGFGKNCYDEVLKYIKSLPQNSIEDISDVIIPRKQPIGSQQADDNE